MSLSSIHYQKILDSVSRYYYASGAKPTEEQVMGDLSSYFSVNRLGSPIGVRNGVFADDLTSSEAEMNEMVSKVIANLDLLYQATAEQVEESMNMNTYMNSRLDQLRIRRKRIDSQIEEYLFTNSNSDGYFYSFLDTFPNLSFVDLGLTSAFVDIKNGAVSIPIHSDKTEVLQGTSVRLVTKSFKLNDVEVSTGVERAEFAGCLDGLTNTYWSTEIVSDLPSEVVCTLELELSSPFLSYIEYEPYGTVPCQVYVEYAGGDRAFRTFGQGIKESTEKMVFSNSSVEVRFLRFTIRKTKQDFISQTDAAIKYNYIIGAKDITMVGREYEDSAVLVTTPISISKDLSTENVLDSISVKVDDDTPDGSFIEYFVALDTGESNPTLFDFDWKKISKFSDSIFDPGMIVNFSGSSSISKYIRTSPETGTDDLAIISEDPANADPRVRNPFRKDGIEVWRLCSFGSEDPIINSLKLEEGSNSLKVYYTSYDAGALDLSFWKDYINGSLESSTTNTRIDTSNGFFNGGDIGENYKSVYMETYLDYESTQNAGIQKFIKTDSNSQLWALKVYLNGAEIGYMPVGTNELNIPWTFRPGLNHIAVTALIPRATTSAYPNEGSINIMQDNALTDFGSVKLANWAYVDIFQLLNNSDPKANLFSIYKESDKVQIISRKKPTNNFKLSYSKPSGSQTQKVRVRADLGRASNNSSVSPLLNSYRLRFRYA